MEAALALERRVNQSLLDLHATADKHEDPQVSNRGSIKSIKLVSIAVEVLTKHVQFIK